MMLLSLLILPLVGGFSSNICAYVQDPILFPHFTLWTVILRCNDYTPAGQKNRKETTDLSPT